MDVLDLKIMKVDLSRQVQKYQGSPQKVRIGRARAWTLFVGLLPEECNDIHKEDTQAQWHISIVDE